MDGPVATQALKGDRAVTKPSSVSIIVTNHNYRQYVAEAISSALAQTYSACEVILIDDASDDGSEEIYSQYAGEMKIITHDRNLGVVATRNEALDQISSDYFVFLDADDVMPDDYVERMMAVAQDTSADVVYGDFEIIDEASRATGETVVFPDFDLSELKRYNFVNMSSLVKRNPHRFDEELDRRGLSHEDWDYFLGLAVDGRRFEKASDVFLSRRVHGESRNSGVSSAASFARKVRTINYIFDKYSAARTDFSEGGTVDPFEHLFEDVDGLVRAEYEHRFAVRAGEQAREMEELRGELQAVLASRSYRIGRLTTGPARYLVDRFRAVGVGGHMIGG